MTTTDKPNFDLRRLMAADLDARARWKAIAQAMLERSGIYSLADAGILLGYHVLLIDRELAETYSSPQSADQREIEARTKLNSWEQRLRQDVFDHRRAGGSSDAQGEPIEISFSRLDSAPAVPTQNVRPRWLEILHGITEEFILMGPTEIILNILQEQSQWIDTELTTAFEAARFHDADAVFVKLKRHLQSVIERERSIGGLKIATPADEIKQWTTQLQRFLWNSFERDGVGLLMKEGQRIIGVDFHSVTLSDGSVISRRILREKLRTPADLSEKYWEARFTSERTLAQAEAAARDSQARSERPFRYGSGPMTDDGRPITR